MLKTLHTPHGDIELPAFLPDATRAVVKAVDSNDLRTCGIKAVMVNVFHLLSQPGIRVIKSSGGIHRFMNWGSVAASDSGGFQIFSLLNADPSRGTVTSKGFVWQVKKPGKKVNLTPEKSIQQQWQLGTDLIVCLDHCTHSDAPPDLQRKALENTIRWAKACKKEHEARIESSGRRPEECPKLFAVVQGGNFLDLRRECAERLIEIGFDGYAFGGWPFDSDGNLIEAFEFTARLLPEGRPRFALGVCGPEHVAAGIRMGYEVFDGALPTRDARRMRLYSYRSSPRQALTSLDFYDRLYLQDEIYVADRRPIDETCPCLLCTSYSRAYLHHLFQIEDPLAWRLATIHNLTFYARLLEVFQEANRQGTAGEKANG